MQMWDVTDQIREHLSGIVDNYSRLVLLVGHSGSGRTTALRRLADSENAALVNLGAEVSLRLLDLGERQRILFLPTLLEELLASLPRKLALLDNTEVLFNPVLRQDPLRLLQRLSRDRTIVASWLGTVESGYLTYAEPGHPEFRLYSSDELIIVSLNQN